IGVRPHYTKLAAFYRPLAASHSVDLIDTGQHFHTELAESLRVELGLPPPRSRLAVGHVSSREQLKAAVAGLGEVLPPLRPDLVVVIGDAMTSFAGALAAAELGLPVAHVEAGIRSSESGLPEETNRRAIDRVATLHI